jgi:tRNA pseudouridine38-40 synthase
MRIGSEALVGRHDYTSFRAVSCQAASPIREITEIRIEQHDKFLNITISANAFLQRMVRNIVGALILVGKKEKDASWLQDVLDGCDRALAGVAAPAQGLTLLSVDYPEKYQLSAD